MKFNEKLQKLRKEHGLSQEQLADELNVSRQAVSKWENGTNYPEMEKILAMCKIFNCSLDELTNDNETVHTDNQEIKKFVNKIIDDITITVDKTVTKFKTMKKEEKEKWIILLIVLVILIVLLKLPFNYLYMLSSNIFNDLNLQSAAILNSIIYCIFNIIYLIIAIIIFIYIYKNKFLNNKEYNFNDLKSPPQDSYIIIGKKPNLFITIIKSILKVILGFSLIPLIIFLITLYAILAVAIGLIFDGIMYYGINLIVFGFIVICTALIGFIIKFIFNKKITATSIITTIISTIILLGFGIGISLIEFSKLNYVDEMPPVNKETVIEEYYMSDNLIIKSEEEIIKYEIDNNLEDKIKIEISYYNNYITPNINVNDDNIYIYRESTTNVLSNELFNFIKEDLKDKTIRNYDNLFELEIKVYGNETNIKKLINNKVNEYRNY